MNKTKALLKIQDDEIKLDKLILRHGISFNQFSQLLRKGKIKLNGKRQKINCFVQSGDVVEIYGMEERVEKYHTYTQQHEKVADQLKQRILYKDNDVLILNKPAGLAVQGGNKVSISVDDVSEFLKFELQNKPKLVHRLDRDTSGILVMARNDLAARELGKMFQESGTIKKHYLALCNGVPYKKRGTISMPIKKMQIHDKELMCFSENGDRAITHYEVLQHNDTTSLIEFTIVTGRTHQIRAHCGMSGMPIIGDQKYDARYHEYVKKMLSPDQKREFILCNKMLHSTKQVGLHLMSVEVDFTLFGNHIHVKCPVPKDFLILQ